MNFSELEQLMSSRGIPSLAEIARTLNTTPQAVSNWKSRNQVPHHIVAKLNQSSPPTAGIPSIDDTQSPITHHASPIILEEDTISLSEILLTMAEQLKVILLVIFVVVFMSVTHVKLIRQPLYTSWATVILQGNKGNSAGGFSGLASQFGVSIPNESTTDLSNPSLYPEILRSRTFAEKILDKKFFTERYNKSLSLLAILNGGNEPIESQKEGLITKGWSELNQYYLGFSENSKSAFSEIKITAFEKVFAKELAEEVLIELEGLSRFFKSQIVNEKIRFIENRIASLEDDLTISELKLKEFNERNRQISSPSLQLEMDRLTRNLEIQKGLYLTLRQQQELAKIEAVQKTSIVQILDKPQVPLWPVNKNMFITIVISSISGILLGILAGFTRSYLNNKDIEERKKIRRVKNFINKKIKDLFFDKKVTGIISLTLWIALPFYLGNVNPNPVFLGMYSSKAMLINTVYVLLLLLFSGLFIRRTYHSRK